MRKLYEAIESKTITVSDVAETYQVSERTVQRWASGEAKPKAEIQLQLSELLDGDAMTLPSTSRTDEEDRVRRQIDSMLHGLRDSIHRWGRYSTRNDALEDLSKLLLAQIHLVRTGNKGLHEAVPTGKWDSGTCAVFIHRTNEALRSALDEHLDKTVMDGHGQVSWTDDQTRLVQEVFTELRKVGWESLEGIERLDVFNEIFGRFLANSFVDEKEMGQYLTPIEMSRFMVRLVIHRLSEEQLSMLTHPERCADFGYVLDPSCGAGSFLIEFLRQLLPTVIERHGPDGAELWKENMGRHVLCGIDKSERMLRLTICTFRSMGVPCGHIYSLNALDTANGHAVLREMLEGHTSIILTNPPFGAEFSGESILGFRIFGQWSSGMPRKVDSELLFMERYVDWLTDNGICATVVPDSVLTNRGLFLELRNGIRPLIRLNAVVSFPPETFGAAGTTTKTSVLCFSKSPETNYRAYFGICDNIGYRVVTKGSQKIKIPTRETDIDTILSELEHDGQNTRLGRWVDFDDTFFRWDANYHGSLSEAEHTRLTNPSENDVILSDVAELINLRVDPRRLGKEFRYIEISDIQPSGTVMSKVLPSMDAPSRARKQVRLGDVLASTVRPEQKKIGYVMSDSDNGAICTTGLAVLRPKRISSSLLVTLLKSDFVTKQLLRNNIGIAYPAVDETCFLNVILPIGRDSLEKLSIEAEEVENRRRSLTKEIDKHEHAVYEHCGKWLAASGMV